MLLGGGGGGGGGGAFAGPAGAVRVAVVEFGLLRLPVALLAFA